MRAFVCEMDHHGLRRLWPEDFLPTEERDGLAPSRSPKPAAVVRALLEEPDAEALRAELAAGRHHDAWGLLLNRAIELMTISVAGPDPAAPSAAAR